MSAGVDQTTWDPHFYVDYYIGYQPSPNAPFTVELVTSGMMPTDVFVHYSPGDIPLTSGDGESLEAIGPQWVEERTAVRSVDGEFPNLDPKIPIPCG